MSPRNISDSCFLLNLKKFLLVLLAGVLWSFNSNAQIADSGYDEVSVFLNVQNVDNTELGVLVKDEKAYLPVSYVFDFLKILNKPSATRDSLSGFFINENAVYLMDVAHHKITYQKKEFDLPAAEFFKSAGVLYLQAEDFGKIFSLYCNFSFRNLNVTITTELELPIMRDARLNRQRTEGLRHGVVLKADTSVKRVYAPFHFGAADWSLTNTYQSNYNTDTRASVALGAVVAGGETNVALSYSSFDKLNRRNQFYSWRLANNDNEAVRQIVVGKLFTPTISSIFAPILGVEITNTPTTFRRAFGTYTLTNTTQPNWLVELYVNNVLVGFVRTDASGIYTFQIPLVYGSSQIKLRFYGPSGEERFSEQNIVIPYNFLPKHEFEYNATAGIVDDGSNARFSRVSMGYGLNSRVTVGGGTEYLSSIQTGNNVIPFVNSSARLTKNLLVSGEYDYNVRTRAVASYNLFSGLQVEYDDTWYKPGQTAIFNTFLEERKGIVSIPIRTKSFAAYTRFTVDQIRLPDSYYTTTEWLLSGSIANFIATVNTYGIIVKDASPYVYSNFSLTTTLFRKYLYTQQVQLDYRNRNIVSFKSQVERHFGTNGYVNLSFENDLIAHAPAIELGIRYDLRFALLASSVRVNREYSTFTQSANGSVIFDKTNNYIGFKNYSNVGKSGVVIAAFLDINNNGKRDAGEPRVNGIKLTVNGGRIEQSVKDSSIRITDLEPYINYLVDVDGTDLENISWKIKKHVLSIATDPNTIKLVEVPVTIVSEVSGRVTYVEEGREEGVGRVIMQFYNAAGKLVTRTTTEQDGYYNFQGLPPGDYVVKIDADQVKELKLINTPDQIKFHIKQIIEGDAVDGLDFVLRPIAPPAKKQ